MLFNKRHDQNYLTSIVKENKHQPPRTENTNNNIVKPAWIPSIGPKLRKEI